MCYLVLQLYQHLLMNKMAFHSPFEYQVMGQLMKLQLLKIFKKCTHVELLIYHNN